MISGCSYTTSPLIKPMPQPQLLAAPLQPLPFNGGDEYDLLRLHLENKSRWADTRDQLEKLIEYVKSLN